MCCTQYLNIIIIIVIDVNIIVNIIKTSAKRSIIWSLPWTDHNAALTIQASTSFDNFYIIIFPMLLMHIRPTAVDDIFCLESSRPAGRWCQPSAAPMLHWRHVHSSNRFQRSLSLSIPENHFNVHFHLSSFTCPPLLIKFHSPSALLNKVINPGWSFWLLKYVFSLSLLFIITRKFSCPLSLIMFV